VASQVDHLRFLSTSQRRLIPIFAVGLISTEQLLDCASRCIPKLNKHLRKSANESPELVRALMAVASQLSTTTAKAVAKVSAESI